MGYYAQLLIEAKERYGHILKERGLVKRGEADGDDLTLVFRSDDGKWRLPVDISDPGKKSTGTDRAEWKDVEVSALVHSKVNC